MVDVVRWYFDYGGINQYWFPRNPDRYGGDGGWAYEARSSVLNVIGSVSPQIQIDGFIARRQLKFTAITGNMKRSLENFYFKQEVIHGCRDHLYGVDLLGFSCFITAFTPTIHPTIGDFPGSGEDTWDLEMELIRMD